MIFTFFLIVSWLTFLFVILPLPEDVDDEPLYSDSTPRFDWKVGRAMVGQIEEELNSRIQAHWLARINTVTAKPTKQDLRDVFGRFGQ